MKSIIRKIKRILKKFYRKVFKKEFEKKTAVSKNVEYERIISAVMKKTGWTREKVKEELKKAQKVTGVSAKNYLRYEFYTLSVEEQIEKNKNIPSKEKNKKSTPKEVSESLKKYSKVRSTKKENYLKKVDKAVAEVARATGWTKEYTERRFWEANERLNCTPFEYCKWKIYNLDNEKQETFFYSTYQKILQKKYGTDPDFVALLYDKERTNNLFSEYVRRPWCVNDKVSFEEFCDTFKDSNRVIYKPIGGHCGYGVEAFYLNADNMREVYNKLFTYPQGVVEEYIVQHSDMSRLAPSSVNSLRFVTISSFDQSAGEPFADIVYAAVRIGRGDAIVDNLHSGGMVANADLETGMLVTGGADHTGTLFLTHPETGTPIKGFKIPYFFEALEMVKEAIEKKRVEGYLGWDLAIAENGPMLLEVNDRPGATVLQTAYAQEGKGMKHVMAKYL